MLLQNIGQKALRFYARDEWPLAHVEQMCATHDDGGLLLDASQLDWIRTILPPSSKRFREGHSRRVKLIR